MSYTATETEELYNEHVRTILLFQAIVTNDGVPGRPKSSLPWKYDLPFCLPCVCAVALFVLL